VEDLDLSELLTWISNQGFAIAIGVYLVYFITNRVMGKLDEIRDLLKELLLEIRKLNSKVA
jgi:hypothetical protein